MQSEWPLSATPPEGLRPAQLGMLLTGRVILVHVSATLVDLTRRGFLGMEEVSSGSGTDWLLTDRRDQADRGHLQDFEVTLLAGLLGGKREVHLSEIGEALVPAVSRFETHLRHDGLRHGWLRRWHRGKLTPGGEQMLRHAHDFRRDLRKLAAEGDVETLAAVRSGLAGNLRRAFRPQSGLWAHRSHHRIRRLRRESHRGIEPRWPHRSLKLSQLLGRSA
jgi:hypothetical protein